MFVKRIINGRVYDTVTATEIAGECRDCDLDQDIIYGDFLFETPDGEHFRVHFKEGSGNDHVTLTPLTTEEAEEWLDAYCGYDTGLIDEVLGTTHAPESECFPAILHPVSASGRRH